MKYLKVTYIDKRGKTWFDDVCVTDGYWNSEKVVQMILERRHGKVSDVHIITEYKA